jgi:hypothetical protein
MTIIKIIHNSFAYFFYRVNSLWLKVGYKNAEHVTSILSLLQASFMLAIWIIIYTSFFVSVQEYKMPTYIYYMFIILMIILQIINSKLYSNNYYIYHSKWENETRKQRIIKGIIIIFLTLTIPFISVVYLAVRY